MGWELCSRLVGNPGAQLHHVERKRSRESFLSSELNGDPVSHLTQACCDSEDVSSLYPNPPKPARPMTILSTVTGTWILGKTIGVGIFGKVKLARNQGTGEQAACKIISHNDHPDLTIRAAREAATVNLLNHPHIASMREVIQTNKYYCFLLEYIDGNSMLDYIISNGKLKEKHARKFCRQISSALDYCHRNNIVHRDLKLENILLTKSGDIKIIDFGLSNLDTPCQNMQTFCANHYFVAPELLQKKAYSGPKVDIWGFGIVLYVMVCGKVPFDDVNIPGLHAKIARGLVDYPNWLSAECKNLISQTIATDPDQRASFQEVMTHPWMLHGYGFPVDNFMPTRGPLAPPFESEAIDSMMGFDFGSTDTIHNTLAEIIGSSDYQSAVELHEMRKVKRVSMTTKKGNGKWIFGVFKRKGFTKIRDHIGTDVEELHTGEDPLNAYHPMISMYYLAREKQQRDNARQNRRD